MALTNKSFMTHLERWKPKKQILQAFVIVCLLLFFSGCTTLDETKEKLKYGTDGIDPSEVKEVIIDPGVYAPEKFTYFFENQKKGFLDFIDYTEEFIYCSIPDIKDNDIATKFKTKHDNKDIEVKLMFDRLTAFTNCDVACVPRSDSKYNTLYAYGLDLSTGNFNSKFCVNEKGVMFFSSNEKEITELHIFYNEDISIVYKDYFSTGK